MEHESRVPRVTDANGDGLIIFALLHRGKSRRHHLDSRLCGIQSQFASGDEEKYYYSCLESNSD
jgi:hypothetical protein